MVNLNRDTIIAIILLVLCGVFLTASFEIREPDYGVLSPAAWPRVIIAVLALLSFIYLIQAITTGRQGGGEMSEASASEEGTSGDSGPNTLREVLFYWRNPFFCFIMFLAFLLTLPYLGMLVAGILFVFFLLNLLGGWSASKLALHALISIVAIGAMWSIFTFGLKVILPSGSLLESFQLLPR